MPPAPLRHRVLAWGSSGLHIPGAGGSATVRTNHCSLCLPLALFGHHLDWGDKRWAQCSESSSLDLSRYLFTSASLWKLPLPLGRSPFSRTTISIYFPPPQASSPSLSILPAIPAVLCVLIPLNLHTSVYSRESSSLGFKFQAQPQTWVSVTS